MAANRNIYLGLAALLLLIGASVYLASGLEMHVISRDLPAINQYGDHPLKSVFLVAGDRIAVAGAVDYAGSQGVGAYYYGAPIYDPSDTAAYSGRVDGNFAGAYVVDDGVVFLHYLWSRGNRDEGYLYYMNGNGLSPLSARYAAFDPTPAMYYPGRFLQIDENHAIFVLPFRAGPGDYEQATEDYIYYSLSERRSDGLFHDSGGAAWWFRTGKYSIGRLSVYIYTEANHYEPYAPVYVAIGGYFPGGGLQDAPGISGPAVLLYRLSMVGSSGGHYLVSAVQLPEEAVEPLSKVAVWNAYGHWLVTVFNSDGAIRTYLWDTDANTLSQVTYGTAGEGISESSVDLFASGHAPLLSFAFVKDGQLYNGYVECHLVEHNDIQCTTFFAPSRDVPSGHSYVVRSVTYDGHAAFATVAAAFDVSSGSGPVYYSSVYFPRLVDYSVSSSLSAEYSDGTVHVSYDVNGSSDANIPVRYIVSDENHTLSVDDVVSFVAPSSHFEKDLELNWTPAAGSELNVIVILNYDHSIEESDYTNNTATATITVPSAPPSGGGGAGGGGGGSTAPAEQKASTPAPEQGGQLSSAPSFDAASIWVVVLLALAVLLFWLTGKK